MKTQSPQRRTTRLAAIASGAALALTLTACSPALSESEPPPPVMTTSTPPNSTEVAATPTPQDDGAPQTVPDIPVTRADATSASRSAESRGLGASSLSIQQRDIVIPVKPVGVEENGDMEIPKSSDEAGWYRFGAGIGADDGTAVVAGHADSYFTNGLGPLAALVKVKEGDRVEVARADGASVEYEVSAVNRTTKTRIDWQEVFSRAGQHRLVIITCGGEFDREAGHYEDNVIVTAIPIGAETSD